MCDHVYQVCAKRADSDAHCGGCRGDGLDCMFDSLSVCSVCDALEGALLPFCPGRRLTYEEIEQHYAHYCAKTGPFARATTDTVGDAVAACLHRWAPDTESLPPRRPGAEALYLAVAHLLDLVEILDGTALVLEVMRSKRTFPA